MCRITYAACFSIVMSFIYLIANLWERGRMVEGIAFEQRGSQSTSAWLLYPMQNNETINKKARKNMFVYVEQSCKSCIVSESVSQWVREWITYCDVTHLKIEKKLPSKKIVHGKEEQAQDTLERYRKWWYNRDRVFHYHSQIIPNSLISVESFAEINFEKKRVSHGVRRKVFRNISKSDNRIWWNKTTVYTTMFTLFKVTIKLMNKLRIICGRISLMSVWRHHLFLLYFFVILFKQRYIKEKC